MRSGHQHQRQHQHQRHARRRTVAGFAGVLLVVVTFAGPSVLASPVDDQQRRVEQIADQLQSMEDRLGELEEQHGAALDRLDELAIEIQESRARVDAQAAELGRLQGQLTDIALDTFMTGGSAGLAPLFSTAQNFTDQLKRSELSRVALDQGAGTSDELQSLIDDLAAETASLQSKQDEQGQLLASLETQQDQGEALTVELQTAYADAKTELGELIVQEQERRAAQAIAAAQARQAELQATFAAANPAPTVRGGGAGAPAAPAASPASGAGPAASTPAPATEPSASTAPPPSSVAGVVVAAAQGQLGVPYQFARSEPGVAFDCSGLTKYAWAKAGVSLPHQSGQQFASTPHVPKDQVQPGDLIFYYSPIGHVGIYIGGGSLIHAPASGDVVKVSAVSWNKVVGVSRPG